MLFPAVYSFLWQIVPPIIRHYLRKRARKNPDYALNWGERFGEPYPNPVQNPIWVHAVSVGETRAAAPLIAALQQHFPNAPLLLTQMTPTGRATAQQLYPHAQCRYLPYDRTDWVAQFVREHKPIFGVLMETEIWANLMHECAAQNVPLFLANARLSEKSAHGYERVLSLISPAMNTLAGCFAQTEADAARLGHIGAKNVLVCGNTKYDIAPNSQAIELANIFKQRIGERAVFVAASTRQYHDVDEAEEILNAWAQRDMGEALLIVVPRHPERFQAAYDCATKLGLRVQKRSDNAPVQPETQVWIGDSMGEMFAYYLAANVAFVGGSLVDTGCQNIIEPMSCSTAVLFGQSIYNFQAACEGALAMNAAKQIASADELLSVVQTWLANPELYAPIADNARNFVAQHQGASERIANAISGSFSAHEN